jgi:hypothetical protein
VLTKDHLERLCLEAGRTTEEGQRALAYTVELLEPRPVGIALPDEWIAEFRRSTAKLAALIDQITDANLGWLGFAREFAERIRRA